MPDRTAGSRIRSSSESPVEFNHRSSATTIISEQPFPFAQVTALRRCAALWTRAFTESPAQSSTTSPRAVETTGMLPARLAASSEMTWVLGLLSRGVPLNWPTRIWQAAGSDKAPFRQPATYSPP